MAWWSNMIVSHWSVPKAFSKWIDKYQEDSDWVSVFKRTHSWRRHTCWWSRWHLWKGSWRWGCNHGARWAHHPDHPNSQLWTEWAGKSAGGNVVGKWINLINRCMKSWISHCVGTCLQRETKAIAKGQGGSGWRRGQGIVISWDRGHKGWSLPKRFIKRVCHRVQPRVCSTVTDHRFIHPTIMTPMISVLIKY